jgi:hypothetical protein
MRSQTLQPSRLPFSFWRNGACDLEAPVLFSIAFILLLCTAVTAFLRASLHFHNERVQYGISHLPFALLWSAVFALFIAVLCAFFPKLIHAVCQSNLAILCVIACAFAVYWLPVVFAGGFNSDDWRLLEAAEIRKSLILHPVNSWYALDTVDGNFRPLGTILYFGYLMKLFGPHPFPFLFGDFLVNLLGVLIGFAIMRELGYSRATAAVASILYLSRGLIYANIAMPAGVGDGIVILSAAVTVLLSLRALKSKGSVSLAFHGLAWLSYCIALLAKQSAFAIPLVVAALLIIRPGESILDAAYRRWTSAAIALMAYGIPASIVYFHAKTLFSNRTPYPIVLTLNGITYPFVHAFLYFVPLELTSSSSPVVQQWGGALMRLLGFGIAAALAAAIWRIPRLLGDRPRDIAFFVVVAIASVSLFIVLPNRTNGYYGAMAALWFSMALAIALTRFQSIPASSCKEKAAARFCSLLLCLLVVFGFLGVRVEQTALIPSGSMALWGTYTSDSQSSFYRQLSEALAGSQVATLVFVDLPQIDSGDYAAMAWLASPHLSRILSYESKSNSFYSNDLGGLRPEDVSASWNDRLAFNWEVPMDQGAVNNLIQRDGSVWIRFKEGHCVVLQQAPEIQ